MQKTVTDFSMYFKEVINPILLLTGSVPCALNRVILTIEISQIQFVSVSESA